MILWPVAAALTAALGGLLAWLLWRRHAEARQKLAEIRAARAETERLARLAYHDHLTGLPNKHFAEVEIDKAIARAARAGRMVAVHFMDVDKFKLINDTHGHAAGDAVLVEMARRLAECVRESDTVARLGNEDDDRVARLHGDEFVVIQCMVRVRTEAERLQERLAACLADPITIDGVTLMVTVSGGFTIAPVEAATAADVLRLADAAMYDAKRQRNGGMGAAA